MVYRIKNKIEQEARHYRLKRIGVPTYLQLLMIFW